MRTVFTMQPLAWERVLSDLIARELRALRPDGRGVPDAWEAGTLLRGGGVELDSLELLHVASRVASFCHMRETGLEDLLLARRTLGRWADVVRRSVAEYSELLSFPVDGSREATLCTNSLWNEVLFHAHRAANAGRVLSAAPSDEPFGFQWGILLPSLLQIPSLDIRGWPAERLADELRAGDLIVTAPAYDGGAGQLRLSVPGQPPLRLEIVSWPAAAGLGWRTGPGPFVAYPWWERAAAGLRRKGDSLTVPVPVGWEDERRFQVELALAASA